MPRIRVRVSPLEDRHHLIKLSPTIAVITKALLKAGRGGRKAKTVAAYFGFSTYTEAQSYATLLRSKHPGCRLTVRKAKRLGTAFEVKFSHEAAEVVAWGEASKAETVSDRIDAHIQQHRGFLLLTGGQTDRAFATRQATLLPRHTGRQMMRTSDGLAIGID